MNYWTVKFVRLSITIYIILTLNFLIYRIMPGDPVMVMLGQDAAALSGQDLQILATQFGLDQPLMSQYISYFQSLVKGDLGYSFYYHQAVSPLIVHHIIWTMVMIIPAILLSSVLAVMLGMLAGWYAGSKLDVALVISAMGIYAMPQFLIAMLLLAILGFRWHLFPLGGLYSGNAESIWAMALEIVWHITLPIVVLTISLTAAKFLIIRNAVVKSLSEDYIVYAIAKGLSKMRILWVHVLKNACLPLISLIAINMGFVVSGALVIEIVFSLNGMGTLMYEAVQHRDYPILQGCVLVLTLFVVGANALADIVYGLLDPRIAR